MSIVPVILSGGFGTRLWPISREANPKQFSESVSTPCLFQKTCDIVKSSEFTKPFVVANEKHKVFLDRTSDYEALICEPQSRNTCPAILVSAIEIVKRFGAKSTMLVMSSDHLITDQKLFLNSVQNGLKVVEKSIVVFGAKPTKPETGYGYIESVEQSSLVSKVKQFKEKPTIEKAESFVKQGNFYWNCGIFLFEAQHFVDLCKELLPSMFENVSKSLTSASIKNNAINLGTEFLLAENLSIDYGILEKTSDIYMAQMLSPWSDIGSFESLHGASKHDNRANTIIGNTYNVNTSNCFVHNTSNSLIATYGIEGLAIVQTNDSTLIAPLSASQDIKKLVEGLPSELRVHSRKSQRPWGTFEVLNESHGFKVKKITVNPKMSLSLQSHKHRFEHWVVVKGVATVINGDDTLELHAGENTLIAKEAKHRLINNTADVIEVIEVQIGEYLGEDDITRYEDTWGR